MAAGSVSYLRLDCSPGTRGTIAAVRPQGWAPPADAVGGVGIMGARQAAPAVEHQHGGGTTRPGRSGGAQAGPIGWQLCVWYHTVRATR